MDINSFLSRRNGTFHIFIIHPVHPFLDNRFHRGSYIVTWCLQQYNILKIPELGRHIERIEWSVHEVSITVELSPASSGCVLLRSMDPRDVGRTTGEKSAVNHLE